MNYDQTINHFKTALDCIDPNDNDYVAVGKAIKNELGELGFLMWDNWMDKASLYNPRDRQELWDGSISSEVKNIDSLLKLAKKNRLKHGVTSSELQKNEVITISPEQQIYHVKLNELQKQTHDEAVTSACLNIWMNAETNMYHDFTGIMGALPYGLLQYGEFLVVPIRKDGLAINLQFIDEKGSVTYLSDGTISGGYHSMGKPDSKPILIGTEFGSVSSAHEATGYFTIAAITDENLAVVANTIRSQFSTNKIILLADNSFDMDDSDGLSKVAATIGAEIAVPQFSEQRFTNFTFNDLRLHDGIDVVEDQINNAFQVVAVEDDSSKASAEETTTINQLLQDINTIFNSTENERLFSRELITNLVALKGRPWHDWNKGKPLTQNALAKLLMTARIPTKYIRIGSNSGRGYYQAEFSDYSAVSNISNVY